MATYPFEYARASSVDEALSLIARHGSEAKFLAGGHSLVPAMKLRLSAPSALIDLNGIDELRGITDDGHHIRIGALTTYATIAASDLVRDHCPVVAEMVEVIGDPQVRNRGTIGGSLAHADPAADYPAAMLALEAQMEIRGSGGTRTVKASDFFVEMFATAVEEGELLTAIRVPKQGDGERATYAKFANPASRYAVVGVAAWARMNGDTCEAVRIALTGAAPKAFRATGVEGRLTGGPLTDDLIRQAVAGMVDASDMMGDVSASQDYRAHLCEVMTRRALLDLAA